MTITQPPSRKQDILHYLLKRGRATVQELAEALDISPQATRRHLKDLEIEESIEHCSIQQKMGRPQYVYQLSERGRSQVVARLAPTFPHRYGEFVVSFLEVLGETAGEKQVSEVLRKQWERKAADYRDRVGKGSLKERVSKLVQLRQEEGFMAELHLMEDAKTKKSEREQFVLAEHNCAISEVAEFYPSVCEHELEMFTAVLPDCVVERTHWINNGEHSCGYLIQAK